MIDLETFVHTGRFGPIDFGTDRTELIALLGQPTSRGPQVRGRDWFWRYGDVQFDWDVAGDDRLHGVHVLPSAAVPTGTSSLGIDPWVVRLGLERAAVEQHLASARIDWWRIRGPNFGFVRLGAGIGVRLTFNEGEANATCPAGLLGVEYAPSYPGPPNHAAIKPPMSSAGKRRPPFDRR